MFFRVSNLKNEEVSQNCFVFEVVKFNIEKVSRIASFLMLSNLKKEDISQNSLVFKLADRQVDRYIVR